MYTEHLTARTFFSVLSVFVVFCTCWSVVTTFFTCTYVRVAQDVFMHSVETSHTARILQKHFIRTPFRSWVFQAFLPSVRHLHRPGRLLQRRWLESDQSHARLRHGVDRLAIWPTPLHSQVMSPTCASTSAVSTLRSISRPGKQAQP